MITVTAKDGTSYTIDVMFGVLEVSEEASRHPVTGEPIFRIYFGPHIRQSRVAVPSRAIEVKP